LKLKVYQFVCAQLDIAPASFANR